MTPAAAYAASVTAAEDAIAASIAYSASAAYSVAAYTALRAVAALREIACAVPDGVGTYATPAHESAAMAAQTIGRMRRMARDAIAIIAREVA